MESRIIIVSKHLIHILFTITTVCSFICCSEQKEHTAPAIHERDSASVMTSYGVNTLISDSGVIKYRIVTERWEVNEIRNPKRWIFEKSLFLEQFDEKFHVQAFIQCDTAYYFTEQKLWELRGRVRVLTKEGLRYFSEQLFWDQSKHEIYSHVYSRIVTPERTLQGSYFRSDEKMTRYNIYNTKGSFEKGDFGSKESESNAPTDTLQQIMRQPASPHPKLNSNSL
jgi:hypothetical protein